MLVYDADAPDAVAVAARLRRLLPLGYPVVALSELPVPPPPRFDRDSVRGTVAWLDVDGRLYTGRRAIGRALIACEGRASLLGRLMLTPFVGEVTLARWGAGPPHRRSTPPLPGGSGSTHSP